MRKPSTATLGRFAGLILVTLAAGAVMLATAMRPTDPGDRYRSSDDDEGVQSVSAPVVIRTVQPETVEVLDIYSGMIHPFERYSVGFEVAGRIDELGRDESGKEFDDGAVVRQGEVLARLDQRMLKARVKEMTALLERAQLELERARQLRDSPARVISEADFQQRVTDLAVAQAQSDQAQKNLEDATLRSPCDGVIARRLVNPGESIAAHQAAMEIVQVDRLLLIVGVPESRVQELENRQRQLLAAAQEDGPSTSTDKTSPEAFRVYVQLMGSDRFGQPWPARMGEVFRISETAHDKTGLFEVEVLLNNDDQLLKPGQIALAKIVIDELTAFRLPTHSVLFRGETPYIYTIQEQAADLELLFWNLGPNRDFRANRVPLHRYIEQEGELIIPELPPEHRRVVVRGQHRLVDGRRVRIMQVESDGLPVAAREGTER